MTPEKLAELFHETYQRLAPAFGCKARGAAKWQDEPNQSLMIAVATTVLEEIEKSHRETRAPRLSDIKIIGPILDVDKPVLGRIEFDRDLPIKTGAKP